MNEIIYVLTNESMPGYVKIGKTTDLKKRIKSLYRTPVPLPFECAYACIVKNANEVEKWLFDIFDDRRVSREREFFEISPERVVVALREKTIKEVTPRETYVESKEDKVALIKARTRRAVFNFKMVDIPIGSELTFNRDEKIKAKVIDNRHIDLNGETLSLSVAADKALRSLGIEWVSVQGPAHWIYEGETLDERRRRFEGEE